MQVKFLKVFVLLLLLAGFGKVAFAQQNTFSIIPKPLKTEMRSGSFEVTAQTLIISGTSIDSAETNLFSASVKELTGLNLQVENSGQIKQNSITLTIDTQKITKPEAYALSVSGKQISLIAADHAGLFYGFQTLLQLIKVENGKIFIPNCIIEDAPRFAYRGMHLDVGRHFFSINTLKKWLDVLAFYKINTFHWHLTDDQGWRIEVKKFPELQRISAFRNETLIGHKRAEPHFFDGKPYGGFYTQAEVKELVRYAQSKFITVIPEIEMPGHAQAVLAAYPNLGCTGGPYQTATYWGVFDDVFCAGNEQTFSFLEDVLDEVMPLFPSKYIHIGGDECPKTKWAKCPKCQKSIADEQLKDEHGLQSYFIGRIEKYVEGKGKKIIGWDEILEGGISPGATVMSWRGEEGGIAAAKLHHDVIMTPEKFLYLDYYQSLYRGEQIAAGGYTPLQKVYNYNPLPFALSTNEQKYIKGVQANVWTEYLSDANKAEYMIFPRIIALAEIAWTSDSSKNYSDFLRRLRLHQKFLKGLNAANHYDDIRLESASSAGITLKTDRPNSQIRYTLNGTLPNAKSNLYSVPILPAKSSNIKAQIFENVKPFGPVYEQRFVRGLAFGKKVELKNNPSGNYNPVAAQLVNGIEGTAFYNTGEWFGFSGDDFEATIDLNQTQEISGFSIGILQYHWQKMWAPKQVVFEYSIDGKSFIKAFETTGFPKEGLNRIEANFPKVKARYIKVQAANQGIIPEGFYGAGGKAWLLVDELTIK